MAKAKKKKRGGFLGLLQQSFSGWKKLAKYAASGKWANDISRAVHRGGAGKRAQKKARKYPAPGIESDAQRARELTAKMQRGEKLTKTELGQAQAITKEYKDRVKSLPADIQRLLNDEATGWDICTGTARRAVGAGHKKDSVAKAIAKVPTETTVIAHDRTGTKNGVKSHKKKVSKADHQASVAAEILKEKKPTQIDVYRQSAKMLESMPNAASNYKWNVARTEAVKQRFAPHENNYEGVRNRIKNKQTEIFGEEK